ncbi:hypothetical protein [Cryobacterium sp. LW097]|uniref:hypothetical protein n=1 Tax=Cryobacterium sp. LW097 TaxID=1978566 RepID=UPI0012481AF4|nr:hypothetical protein [Cryobacterium sp. LW097]
MDLLTIAMLVLLIAVVATLITTQLRRNKRQAEQPHVAPLAPSGKTNTLAIVAFVLSYFLSGARHPPLPLGRRMVIRPRMFQRSNVIRPLLIVPLLAVVLAGCAPSNAPATVKTAAPTASSTPTPDTGLPADDEFPLTTPAPTPLAEPGTLTAGGAYRLCMDASAQNQIEFNTSSTVTGAPRTRADYENAPLADSTVIDRGDGYFFVYSDLTDHSAAADISEAGASYCLVGGTLSEPLWETYGLVERNYGETLDPYAPFSSME